jgi:hypothetical protein
MDKVELGQVSSSTSVSPANLHSPIAPQSPSSVIWGWYNRAVVAAVPSGFSLMPRFHGAWHASVRQVFASTTNVNEASWKFLWRHRQEWGLTLHINHVWFSVVSLPLLCLHDPRLVGSRLQIHESKYERVARFRIHAPWKRGFTVYLLILPHSAFWIAVINYASVGLTCSVCTGLSHRCQEVTSVIMNTVWSACGSSGKSLSLG